MLKSDELKVIMPGCAADLWLPHLNKVMADRQINSPLRVATFLAHVAVESGEMRTLVENLNYSVGRLMTPGRLNFRDTIPLPYPGIVQARLVRVRAAATSVVLTALSLN